jgi:L-arabinokinase
MIVAYISGHGFGHATRVGEVLREVREQAPGIPLAVVTSGPEALYREAIPSPFEFRARECDLGLAQRGALVFDTGATAVRWRRFARSYPPLVEAEAAWLRHVGAHLVLGDIPPLAFDAAAVAGVPGVGLANFSWDWVYRHLATAQPELGDAAAAAASAYGRARLLLQLPFAGDLSAFPRREPIPLVARRPRGDREETRKRLGLPQGPLVLLSFGGLGLPGFAAGVLGGVPGLHFLIEAEAGTFPDNVTALRPEAWRRLGLGYQDLVAAADVIVTKPGYGIVTDAIAARTRLVYTERGDFPEYPVLVAEMPRYLPCAHVSNADLLAGRLEKPVRAVLGQPFPEPPALDGARVAAGRLCELAARPRERD